MFAVSSGHVSTVDLLIRSGCDVNLKTNVWMYSINIMEVMT